VYSRRCHHVTKTLVANVFTMSSTYRSIAPITHQRDIFSEPVSSLCFDPVSDILWTGSNSGQVIAYHGITGTRGVSFRVGGNLPVKKIVAGENYVRASAMSGEGIGCWSKGGANRWMFR
jgi:PAB-dependent poly(A)-specific ribonuclease subunit 2